MIKEISELFELQEMMIREAIRKGLKKLIIQKSGISDIDITFKDEKK